MPLVELHDLADPRLDVFTNLTDSALRKRIDSERGLYLAESKFVFERALGAGHEPQAVLVERSAVPEIEFMLSATGQADAARAARGLAPLPLFTGDAALLAQLTGFELHHGVIGCMNRPTPLTVAEVISGAVSSGPTFSGATFSGATHSGAATSEPARVPVRRLVIIEGVVDPTNVGLIFRSTAGLGAGGVLLTPHTADPLYRRAVRLSMGTVLQVPWAHADGWRSLGPQLHEAGFHIAALALDDRSVTLDEFAAQVQADARASAADLASGPGRGNQINTPPTDRLALVLGSEGYGVSEACLRTADTLVEIPMSNGVDSLNVAAASAVAMWALR